MRYHLNISITAILVLLLVQSGRAEDTVPRWTVYEAELTAQSDFNNPFWDATVQVIFSGPSGQERTVEAFWDGERTWRVRFSPEDVGEWTWTSSCEQDDGLNDQEGRFDCVAYEGDNPLYQHGPVVLSEDRYSFAHENGTPFFWMGDTAWNGVLRANSEDWNRYLAARRDQKFNVIQFVTTQWRGGTEVLPDRAFTGDERIRINPDFYQKRDPLVAAINDHGLVAAPVLLWALTPTDPGQRLPIDDAIRLARYMVARWGAHQVVWFLGGDGRFLNEHVERWKAIGPGVFEGRRDRLVTLHPSGLSWVGDDYAEESWFDFIGYQSGHGDNDDHLRWLVNGPPANAWRDLPAMPVLNLEPNYEIHPSYHSKILFDEYHIRRASYWSLLVSPTAGVSYGHNAIWVWNEEPAPAEEHANVGTVPPWHEGIDTPGIRDLTRLVDYFASGPWPALRPAQELLTEQPGRDDPNRYVTASKTEDGTWALVYIPLGDTVSLATEALQQPATARWFDPRTGDFLEAGPLTNGIATFEPPNETDWVLDIRAHED